VRADFSHRDFPCSCVRPSVTRSLRPSVQLVSSLGSRSFFHGEQQRAGIFHPWFFCSRPEASIPACVTAVRTSVDFPGSSSVSRSAPSRSARAGHSLVFTVLHFFLWSCAVSARSFSASVRALTSISCMLRGSSWLHFLVQCSCAPVGTLLFVLRCWQRSASFFGDSISRRVSVLLSSLRA
jgi:hypothetical protein